MKLVIYLIPCVMVVLKNYEWEITSSICRCLFCQQVKIKGQKPSGSLQLLPIPEWEWEYIMIDLVVKLLRMVDEHYDIQMTVDWPIKTAHILPVKKRLYSWQISQFISGLSGGNSWNTRVYSFEFGWLFHFQIFGRHFRRPWVANWISVLLSIVEELYSR
jgi:hypothetical protein